MLSRCVLIGDSPPVIQTIGLLEVLGSACAMWYQNSYKSCLSVVWTFWNLIIQIQLCLLIIMFPIWNIISCSRDTSMTFMFLNASVKQFIVQTPTKISILYRDTLVA